MSCGGKGTPVVQVDPQKGAESRAGEPLVIVDRAVCQRTWRSELSDIGTSVDAEMRKRVAWAIGRIGSAKGVETLIKLLEDEAPSVRREAAFSAGFIRGGTNAELISAMVRRIKEENTDDILAILLKSIAVFKADVIEENLVTGFIEDARPMVRAAAIDALTRMQLEGVSLSSQTLKKIVAALNDPDEKGRIAAAHSLNIVPLVADATITAIKEKMFTDPSDSVRILAATAIAKAGRLTNDALSRLLAEPNYLIGVSALREANANGCELTKTALFVVHDRLSSNPSEIETPFYHVVRTALHKAATCRDNGDVLAHAKSIDELLGEQMDEGSAKWLLHCASLKVYTVDELALISCHPEDPTVGKHLLIDRLKLEKASKDSVYTSIMEMTKEADLSVAATALSALPEIDNVTGRQAVLEFLDDPRGTVSMAALSKIITSSASYCGLAQSKSVEDCGDLINRISRLIHRFKDFEHAASPLVLSAVLLGRLGRPESEPLLRMLFRDTRPAVRDAAATAYEKFDGIMAPAGRPPLKPQHDMNAADKTQFGAKKRQAIIYTSQGAFTVALAAENAPVVVSNFAALAKSGYYNGTGVRRKPGEAVVHFGDPTSTGYGDPGYLMLEEPHWNSVDRGTLVMEKIGSGAIGARFFVVLTRRPELDGRHTVLGRIVSNIDLLDVLSEDDEIISIVISAQE